MICTFVSTFLEDAPIYFSGKAREREKERDNMVAARIKQKMKTVISKPEHLDHFRTKGFEMYLIPLKTNRHSVSHFQF